MWPAYVGELGCGTAHFGAWLARRGARITGIDNSAEQLKTARRLQNDHDLHFPLIHRNAEDTGLPDASFDLAVSEYGAALWADPHRWIPEAARILRPGGELSFLGNGTCWVLTVPETDNEGPATERLLRPYFEMHRFDWAGQSGVEFHLGYADWIRLLRASGFEVRDLIEIRAPDDLTELPVRRRSSALCLNSTGRATGRSNSRNACGMCATSCSSQRYG